MKNVLGFLWIAFLILAGLFVATHGKATDFPAAQHDNTQTETLVAPTVLQTNLAGSGVFVEKSCYHTIHVINTGTNSAYVGIDRSLDNSHWVIVGTNTVAASATGETTFTGHYSYVRARCYSTNTTLSALYLGGN